MEKNGEKGWLVSEKSEDLLKATEYIKAFKERRDEKNQKAVVKEPRTSGTAVLAGNSKEGDDKDTKIQRSSSLSVKNAVIVVFLPT